MYLRGPVKQGFTLIELLVVIAIIALLAALLFPVFAKAREKANQATCISNQRQIAAALTLYIQENDELCPSTATTWQAVGLYGDVLRDPSTNKVTTVSAYGYNAQIAGMALGNITSPQQMILTADSYNPQCLLYNSADLDTTRHDGQFIASFVDGHVDKLPTVSSTAYLVTPTDLTSQLWSASWSTCTYAYASAATKTLAILNNGNPLNGPPGPFGVGAVIDFDPTTPGIQPAPGAGILSLSFTSNSLASDNGGDGTSIVAGVYFCTDTSYSANSAPVGIIGGYTLTKNGTYSTSDTSYMNINGNLNTGYTPLTSGGTLPVVMNLAYGNSNYQSSLTQFGTKTYTYQAATLSGSPIAGIWIGLTGANTLWAPTATFTNLKLTYTP